MILLLASIKYFAQIVFFLFIVCYLYAYFDFGVSFCGHVHFIILTYFVSSITLNVELCAKPDCTLI